MRLFDHLSRITTPGRTFIPQIDGLRFIAIMVVIAYHVQQIALFHFGQTMGGAVSRIFDAGHYGVALFFAVSGFILSLPFAKASLNLTGKHVSLGDYYRRRVSRIEPPYVIHLLFLFLLCAFVLRRLPAHAHLFHNDHWLGYVASHLLASLVYANGFIFGAHPYPNVVLWSLEVEVQFYLLAPFLAKSLFGLRAPGPRRAIMVATMLIVPAIWSWICGEGYHSWTTLPGNIQFFLAGFLLADVYLTGGLEVAARKFTWDVLLLASAAAMVFIQMHEAFAVALPWAILLVCLAAFRGKLTAWFLAQPVVITIGGMCYTIYMYHWFMISLLIRVTGSLQTKNFALDLLIQFAVMVPVIVLVCAVLFAMFERPFMRRDWPARLRSRVGGLLKRPGAKPAAAGDERGES